MNKILKRDGRLVPFDEQKITNAILKAFKSIDGNITEYAVAKSLNIANYIKGLSEEKNLTVEEIQDLVQNGLMSTKRKDVAVAYILYREERTREREKKSTLIKDVGAKLMANNIENQNANVDEKSFGGRKGEASNILMKQYALDYVMSSIAKENHLNNVIYTHDLDSYATGMHNCLSVPFDLLLSTGFNTRQVDIRPANSVQTAFQLVAVIFQLQSLQQFGGVSATHLDWTMVPYVRKSFYKHWHEGMEYIEDYPITTEYGRKPEVISINDAYYRIDKYPKAYKYAMKMTEKEIQQAVEAMYHNLNSLQSRSGNQLPFTSVNYGTCTLPEGRMVTKALLEGSIKGVGKLHKTSIFPCGIFQCMKGVNRKEGEPNYDLFQLALKSTAKRLYPNYANVDWSGNAGYIDDDPKTFFSTMGCRTANGYDVNGFGQLKDGRGNIAPVTIIMPTIAMEAKETAIVSAKDKNGTLLCQWANEDTVELFMQMLDEKIYEAKDQLIERFLYICSQPMESAKFMYENNVMAGYEPEEGIISALKHGTLAVG